MPGKAPEKAPAFSQTLAEYEAMSQRHVAYLAAWREHPDKEKLWQALQVALHANHQETPDAQDFIGAILSSTLPVKILNDHNDRVLDQFEKLKLELKTIVANADDPLELWRHLQRFEDPLTLLSKSAYDMHTPAGGRKDQDGSRDRRAFVQRLGRYLHTTCGQHLYKEVATMLDIFFPGSEDPERLVRKWLPPEPIRRKV